MKHVLPLFALVVFLGAACSSVPIDQSSSNPTTQTPAQVANLMATNPQTTDSGKIVDSPVTGDDFDILSFSWATTVKDVTNKETIRGINTKGGARGDVFADIVTTNKNYVLFGTFDNLPDPKGDDFYEGWIVRRGENFSVISTGKLVKNDTYGVYENFYMSNEDLTDHDFYVLTLEPNDDDPAPADHILEGTLRFR